MPTPAPDVPAADFEQLYRHYVTLVRGRAQRILGNAAAAQDVAQEAFVRLIEYRARGGADRETAAFLYTVATNLALNRLRDGRRRQELLSTGFVADAPAAQSPEDRIVIRQLLAVCPEEDATIASYHYLDGLEHEEIAQLLGLERRTIGRRLERFRAFARDKIAFGSDGENAHG